jgi:3-oxoacyl-[acyl-carrier-protein] synthase-3
MVIHVLSAASALPGPAIDNHTLARRLRMDPLWEQWVDAFIGTRTRHLAVDMETGDMRCGLADLGETAARKALNAAGLDPAAVDVVVMATATPDQLMPATVNVIADRLGVDGVPSYQLQSGCAGAVAALELAGQLLTGRRRNALVIGGDVIARFYDLAADLSQLPPAELVNYVLFGDGAGAAVLSVDPAPGAAAIRAIGTRLVGQGRAPGATLEWFGPVDRDSRRPASGEDYKAVEEHVPVMAEEILRDLLTELDWRDTDIDFLLPPQLSGRMTPRIVRRLDVPKAVEVSCVAETGNNGNAIVFFQLERLLGRLAPRDRAVGISVESSKWIKAGFALEGV